MSVAGIKFSILTNTKSDITKAIAAFVTAAVPLSLAAYADGSFTAVEVSGVLGAGILAALAALGFYHVSAEAPVIPTPDQTAKPVFATGGYIPTALPAVQLTTVNDDGFPTSPEGPTNG